VEYEESYYAERSKRTIEDPCLMILLCQHGEIYPWGGTRLAASTYKNGPVASKLRKLPFVDLAASRDGDDGVDAVFDVAHFDEVAAIMKPRRRRRLTPEQRQAATERLTQYQPAKGQSVQDLARQSDSAARTRDPGTRSGHSALKAPKRPENVPSGNRPQP